MILITSSGEFSFIILLSVFFFLVSLHCLKKKPKKKGRIVSVLFGVCLVIAAGVYAPVV